MKSLPMLSRGTEESEVLRILLIIFPILLSSNVVDSALVKFPNNIAVTNTTSSTKFGCKSDEDYELKWFMQANNTVQRHVLALGNDIRNDQAKSYCSIENEEGGEFILILSIQYESAQTYTCHEPDTNQERSAELIIMEPTKFEKDINDSHVVTLECSVNFRGNWAPELELRHNGTSVVKGVEVFVVPNQNVSTTLIIPRNDRASAGKYTCTVRFNLRGKPQRTTDNSVPNYMKTSILTIGMEEIHPDIPSDGNLKGSVNTTAIVCVVIGGVAAAAGGGGVAAWIAAKKVRKKNATQIWSLGGRLLGARLETISQSPLKPGGFSTWVEVDSAERRRTTNHQGPDKGRQLYITNTAEEETRSSPTNTYFYTETHF